jgi:subtilisin family serine protease
MATPLVSGCIALLFSYNPNLTNDQAVDIITTYVSDVYELNPEYPGMLGSGLVNPFLALDALSNSEPGQLTDANGGGGPSDYTLQPGPGSHG